MSGWAALGEILGGGVKRQAEDEYAPQMARNGSAFKLIEEARKERAMNMMRESLTDQDFIAAGYSPQQAALMRKFALSNNTVDARNLDNWIDPNYLPAKAEIGRSMGLGDVVAPPLDTAGRQRIADLQVAISPTPVKRNEIEAGTAYDPFTIGDKGTLTELGKGQAALLGARVIAQQAQAGAANARAGASRASADASNARAAQTRDRTDNPGKYRAPAKDAKGKSDKKPTQRWNPTTKKLEPIK